MPIAVESAYSFRHKKDRYVEGAPSAQRFRSTPVLHGLISVIQVSAIQVSLFLADKSCGFVSYECQFWCECSPVRGWVQGYCGAWDHGDDCGGIVRVGDRRLTQLACEWCKGWCSWPGFSASANGGAAMTQKASEEVGLEQSLELTGDALGRLVAEWVLEGGY
jgi:hypothetical protein